MRSRRLVAILTLGLVSACGASVAPATGVATDGGTAGQPVGIDASDDGVAPGNDAGPGAWSLAASPTQGLLRAVWGSSSRDVWICDAEPPPSSWGQPGQVLHGDGVTWSDVSVSGATNQGCRGIWGSSAADVWFVGLGRDAHLHWDGQALQFQGGRDDREPLAVWGADAKNVFAVGPNLAERWDGTQWIRLASGGTNGEAVSGADATHVLSAGIGIDAWNGVAWANVFGALPPLHGIWVSGPNDAWVAGDTGTLARWDGASWSPVTDVTTVTLRALWGGGPANVWAVGDAGTILHFDGQGWSASPSPTTSDLYAVWGDPLTGDVFAVGAAGTIVHRTPTR